MWKWFHWSNLVEMSTILKKHELGIKRKDNNSEEKKIKKDLSSWTAAGQALDSLKKLRQVLDSWTATGQVLTLLDSHWTGLADTKIGHCYKFRMSHLEVV